MKFLFLVFVCSFSLNAYSQYADDEFNYGSLMLAAKESQNEVFVVTKDGEKHSGKKFSTPSGFAMSVYLKIDDTKYPRRRMSDIIAWQNESSYHIYYPEFSNDVVRLLKGKINLYLQEKITGGSATTAYTDIYFLMEKGEGNFSMAKFENMEEFFSDNAAVLKKYHELYPEDIRNKGGWPRQKTVKQENSIYQNMITLVRMYNQTSSK